MIGDFLKGLDFLKLAGFAIILYFVRALVISRDKNNRIKKLGGRAPTRPSWIPGGFDVAYRAGKALMIHESYEFFKEGLDTYANKNHPYTLEFSIGEF